MKAFVSRGPGLKAIEDRPKPEIQAPGDAIVKMVKTTILFWVTKSGIRLPAWASSESGQKIWDVVAFLRTAPQMKAADCDAPDGDGRGVSPAAAGAFGSIAVLGKPGTEGRLPPRENGDWRPEDGMISGRSLALGARTPWKRMRWSLGRGTSAARRCMSSSGDITTWVVPSW